ncbi:ABC transporter permease family protein [Salinibius halmophilus]|uniref:hypothetical protein n=1 Tax=Salinibius halmophilus TaxID=1853216 RepID=UPI001314985E|nr:hypothetical protein [Salinibius halmophilus]
MLPELSLSWCFVKPLRSLLAFLIILLASFMAIGLMYWQTLQDYQQNVPAGAAPNHYFSVGYNNLSHLGDLQSCTIYQFSQTLDTAVSAPLLGFDNGELVGPERTVKITSEQIQTASQNFLSFFGVEPVERFFDHQQRFQERWVYLNEAWWLANQEMLIEHNGLPAIALRQQKDINGKIISDRQVFPVAGILPANFHPYQDSAKPNIIVSNGMFHWYIEQNRDQSHAFQPPLATSEPWIGELFVTTKTSTTAKRLERQLNRILLDQPAACAGYDSSFRQISVLPGTRTDLAAYQTLGESVSLLSLIMIGLGLIVGLYTLAFAQRLQQIRQPEFLLKIAMGASPNRIGKQVLVETALFSLLALVFAVVLYLPLNVFADTIGFVSARQFTIWPWLVLLMVIFAIGLYLVLSSRKVADPEYVYQGLNNLRHNIVHNFWWMQLNHAAYLVILAIAVLIIGLVSTSYWRQLAPNDALSKTDYKVLIADIEKADGSIRTYSEFNATYGPEWQAVLRNHPDDLAMQCGLTDFPTQSDAKSMTVHGSQADPVTIINSQASHAFFKQVLDMGSVQGRNALISASAAKSLNISTDTRDLADIQLSSAPVIDASGKLTFIGRQNIQGVLPAINMPNLANVPILYSPKRVPSNCLGIIWVAPQFDLNTLPNDRGQRYRLLSWHEYMALEQEVAVQRLRLVLVLSTLAMVSLFAIVLLNTSYLFKHMQPWYWLNIAQGMPPRVAKMQTQLRIGVLSAIALVTALVIAVFGFYEFFPLVSQWLPKRDALNLAVIATVLILVVQQVSLWWCARTLNNKDLSVWQG